MNDTRKKKKEKKTHTANYLVSRFLMSKYSRKKRYDLNLAKRGFLRFIADSIDISYKKYKKYETKLSQSQIATQNGVDRKTINRISVQIVAAKILKYDEKKQIYRFGRVLLAYTKLVQPLEVGHFGTDLRSVPKCPTSNSFNFTNRNENLFDRKNKKYSPTESAAKVSDILDDWAKKNGKNLTKES